MSDTRVHCIGIGLASGHGFGKAASFEGLMSNTSIIAPLSREGRQIPGQSPFVGVELPAHIPTVLPRRTARATGLVGQVCAAVVKEAWDDAGPVAVSAERVGLILGGSNLQAREHGLLREKYAQGRTALVPPRLGYGFFDTDIAALLGAEFDAGAFVQSVGAASASGALAVHQAVQAIKRAEVDVCIAVGALQDLSWVELQALRNLGAMGPKEGHDALEAKCRPFDRQRDGFFYGESAAALVLAREGIGTTSYGTILGMGRAQSPTRGPEPSVAAELSAARNALHAADLNAADIEFVSAHATGTPAGDDTEVQVLHELEVRDSWVTAPKSSIGHGLAAAGAVEIALTFLQMQKGLIAPIHNLENPIANDLKFARGSPVESATRNALVFSFGFGGINLATILHAAKS